MSESGFRGLPLSNVPIPDPSLLTNVALENAKRELKAQFDSDLKAMAELFETKLGAQKELSSERYASLKENVETAFVNATTATSKSEASTAKELDSLKIRISTTKEVMDEKLGMLAARMDRMQGLGAGAQRTTDSNRENLALGVAVAAVLVAGFSAYMASSRVVATLPTTVAPLLSPIAPLGSNATVGK